MNVLENALGTVSSPSIEREDLIFKSNEYLYLKLGFDLINESNPDYKYIVDGKRSHKSNFKKTKLKYTCTEKEYTSDLIKIWDCGKLKYEMNIQ